jgi:hypothetical protein
MHNIFFLGYVALACNGSVLSEYVQYIKVSPYVKKLVNKTWSEKRSSEVIRPTGLKPEFYDVDIIVSDSVEDFT